MAESFSLREERDVTTVINHAVAYFRNNFRSLLHVLAAIAGPAVLVLATTEALGRLFFARSLFVPDDPATGLVSADYLYYLFYFLAMVVTYILVQVTAYSYMRADSETSEAETGSTPGVASVWKVVRSRLLSVLGGMIVGSVIVGLPLFVLLIGTGGLLVGASQGSLVGSLLGVAVLFIGTMAWFGWMVGRLCVYIPVLIIEDAGPISGLKRSWQLTRGAFWKSLGVLLLITVIVYILTIGFSIPVMLAEFANELMDLPLTAALILLDSVVLVASMLMQAGYGVALGLHYFSLAEAKDAAGLMNRIDALEAGRTPAAASPAPPSDAVPSSAPDSNSDDAGHV